MWRSWRTHRLPGEWMHDLMMRYREDDSNYACADHETLSPDAWTQVHHKRPIGEGAKAAIVCQFACRAKCPFGDQGNEIIANGGWFTANGTFIKPPDNMLESHQAAAYLGLDTDYLKVVIRNLGIKTVRGPSLTTYIPLSDVLRIAERHGPRHGTLARYNLHVIRGEVPCVYCTGAKSSKEMQSAGVL